MTHRPAGLLRSDRGRAVSAASPPALPGWRRPATAPQGAGRRALRIRVHRRRRRDPAARFRTATGTRGRRMAADPRQRACRTGRAVARGRVRADHLRVQPARAGTGLLFGRAPSGRAADDRLGDHPARAPGRDAAGGPAAGPRARDRCRAPADQRVAGQPVPAGRARRAGRDGAAERGDATAAGVPRSRVLARRADPGRAPDPGDRPESAHPGPAAGRRRAGGQRPDPLAAAQVGQEAGHRDV